MRFVEIEGTIINIDSIRYVYKTFLDIGRYACAIKFTDDDCLAVNELYYNKLKELLHPIHLTDDRKHINVNDFPGDNMIEE